MRGNASIVLGKIGGKADNVINALVHTLEDKNKEVRKNAVAALNELGYNKVFLYCPNKRGKKVVFLEDR